MKKILWLVMPVILLTSCQKELSVDPNPVVNEDTILPGLLRKEVSVYLPDNLESLVYEYEYNSSRQLVSRYGLFRMTDPNGGILKSEGTNVYTRDGQGRVVTIDVESGSKLFVEYETGTDRVKKVHNNTDQMYMEYVFGSDGHLHRINHFQRFPTSTDGFKLFAYNLYKFNDAGNLTEKSFYNDVTGGQNMQLQSTIIFEYDNKFNPHYSTDYALYTEIWDAPSPNNVTRHILVYNNGNNRDTTNYSFTYDNLNRPLISLKNNDTETKYYYY